MGTGEGTQRNVPSNSLSRFFPPWMPSLTALRSDTLETNRQQMSMEGCRGPARPRPCRFSKGRIFFCFGVCPTPLSPPNTPPTYNPFQNGCMDPLSLPRQDLTTGKVKMKSPGLGTVLQASAHPWQKLMCACLVEACARAITRNSFGERVPWSVPQL